MKVTRKEAVDFYTKLTNLKSAEYNKFLLYTIMKNKIALKKIYDDLVTRERALVTNDDIMKFEKSRLQILQEFSRKDEAGNPIIIENRYDISEDSMIDFQKKMRELQDEYKEVLEKQQADSMEHERYVFEEIEIEETKTAFKNLPETMTPDVFETLVRLAEDPE